MLAEIAQADREREKESVRMREREDVTWKMKDKRVKDHKNKQDKTIVHE